MSPADRTSAPIAGRVPERTRDTAYFWEGVEAGDLLLQECQECHRRRHPPSPSCPECMSLEWVPAPFGPGGRVHSFTVVHHPRPAAFPEPYVAVLLEMEPGIRLVTNLVDTTIADVEIGMSVVVRSVEVGQGVFLPLAFANAGTA